MWHLPERGDSEDMSVRRGVLTDGRVEFGETERGRGGGREKTTGNSSHPSLGEITVSL